MLLSLPREMMLVRVLYVLREGGRRPLVLLLLLVLGIYIYMTPLMPWLIQDYKIVLSTALLPYNPPPSLLRH